MIPTGKGAQHQFPLESQNWEQAKGLGNIPLSLSVPNPTPLSPSAPGSPPQTPPAPPDPAVDHLEFGNAGADLVDVGQGAAVEGPPAVGQPQLLRLQLRGHGGDTSGGLGGVQDPSNCPSQPRGTPTLRFPHRIAPHVGSVDPLDPLPAPETPSHIHRRSRAGWTRVRSGDPRAAFPEQRLSPAAPAFPLSQTGSGISPSPQGSAGIFQRAPRPRQGHPGDSSPERDSRPGEGVTAKRSGR